MSNTDFQWALPPAPGQPGGQPQQQPRQPPPPSAGNAPYGFGLNLRPVGTPPFSPYQPTWQNPALRDRPASDWGTDDWVLTGMKNYPDGEMPSGMHVPTEGDIPGLMHGMVMGFGRWAPPGVANPMIAAGNNYNWSNKSWAAGYKQQAEVYRQQSLMAMKQSDYNLSEQQRKYKNAWVAYGPSADGKDPGEPDRLHERIEQIARETGDTTVLAMLERGDYKAVDRLMKYMDGQGQDLKKTIQLLDIATKREKLKGLQDKDRQAEAAVDIYRKPTGTGAAAAGVAAPTGAAPPGMPQGVGSPADMGPAPQSNDANPSVDLNSTPNIDKPAAPDKDTDTDTTPETPEEPARPAQPSQAEDQEEDGQPQAAAEPAGAQPTGLAQAARAAGAPVMAADDETQPSPAPAAAPPAQARAAPPAAAPAAAPAPAAGAARAAPAEISFAKKPSAALNAAHQAGYYNDDLLNGLALSDVNGTMKIQQARDIPAAIRPFVIARSQEMGAEFRRILNDDSIRGERVYTEIAKFNPEFAATLKGYVNGNVPPPASAWQNAAYRDRIVGLGNKADPGFSYHTFKNRSQVLADFSKGQEGRTVTSINTAYDHAARLLYYLDHRPNFVQRLLGGIPGVADIVASKQTQQELGAMQNYINTFNSEYESALAKGGRATVTARGEQAQELPLVMGNTETMRGNILSKIEALRARSGELRDQFTAGTGIQPQAMNDWMSKVTKGEVKNDGAMAVQQMERMNRGIEQSDSILKNGGVPMPPAQNLVPGKTIAKGHLFMGGDPKDPNNWRAVDGPR